MNSAEASDLVEDEAHSHGLGLLQALNKAWTRLKGRTHRAAAPQVECARCGRIKLGHGHWVTNGGYSAPQGDATPARQAHICPDCARREYAMAGYRNQHTSS